MKLLDTSVVVDVDRGGVDDKVERLDDEGRHGISIVTLTEIRLGANLQYQSGTDRHRTAIERLDRLCSRFDVFDVTRPVATAAADIVGELRTRGEPLNDLHDVYVAATARTEQLPVLTGNVDHFDHIDDVTTIDWQAF